MPLFVMLLMLVVSIPAKTSSMTEEQQMERYREELRVLREKCGDDAKERMREHLSVL